MDDDTNDVTNDVTGDLTNDLAKARHISDLIVSCCRMNSAWNDMYETAFVAALHSSKYFSSCITGSCVELYITPGVTCIGDVDLMFYVKNMIVVSDGSADNSLDNMDIEEQIKVFHIETYCPKGYVHLRLFGKLQFNWETEQFEYGFYNSTGSYLRLHDHNDSYYADVLHGPARLFEQHSSSNVDIVPCIRHLVWPSVAQSWISRDRQYSWPSNAIVSEVQRNGCDLV